MSSWCLLSRASYFVWVYGTPDVFVSIISAKITVDFIRPVLGLIDNVEPVFANALMFAREQLFCTPGGRLNKKDGLTRYGNSHVKDKTS